jgi:hypothetical protein
MTPSEKLDFLVSLFHNYLKNHPNQLFVLRSMFDFPEWEELNYNLHYLSRNISKINSRLMRLEGVFMVGDNHTKKFFYSSNKLPFRWNWNKQLVERWFKWAIQNRLVPRENQSPFPEMGIIYDHQFVSIASSLRLKFYFPNQIKVTLDNQEASIWELSFLKKPYLKALV